jgi:hypothetical protein
MKVFVFFLTLLSLVINHALAEDKDSDSGKSSNLTPTAERSTNMANPEKPGWLPQRHGK